MKVGSLVEYISFETYDNMITPEKNTVYTVRFKGLGISPQRPRPHIVITLEEIMNGPDSNGREYCYVAAHFIELQEPMDISELIREEVRELVLI